MQDHKRMQRGHRGECRGKRAPGKTRALYQREIETAGAEERRSDEQGGKAHSDVGDGQGDDGIGETEQNLETQERERDGMRKVRKETRGGRSAMREHKLPFLISTLSPSGDKQWTVVS